MFSITYIANCGYLINYEKGSILLDALYELPPGEEQGLSGHQVPDPDVLSRIMNRETPFSNVSLLLFTHTHWDHASEKLAAQYNGTYLIPAVFPNSETIPFFYEDEAVRIEAIPSTHDLMTNYDHCLHWCYRIMIDNTTLLFTGDLDVHQQIPETLYDVPVDLLFLNVHHILIPQGRTAVTELFRPKQLFIQHLPDPDYDIYTLRKRLRNKLNVYGDTLPPYTVLATPMTQIL